MVRTLHNLSDKKIKSIATQGRHSDGGGLYLVVKKSGSKAWAFMWKRSGKRTETGLGSYPTVTLAAARKVAQGYRVVVSEGGDPLADKRKLDPPTLQECLEVYLETFSGKWTSEKHAQIWRSSIENHCAPMLSKKVSDIDFNMVLTTLRPVWVGDKERKARPDTAKRVRQRLERLLDYAKTSGWRTGDNPAAWRGNLQNVLPAFDPSTRVHHPAMAFEAIPEFMLKLKERPALAARCLEVLILTCCRTGEVLGAKWPEFDIEARVWTVPAERMKNRKPHRVPLSEVVLELVDHLWMHKQNDYVFPSTLKDDNVAMSNMAMLKLMERMEVTDAVPHGFRSSFRDWAGDRTSAPRDVAEGCLAHQIGNEVERAYRRGDALEKRRDLMEQWANYCMSESAGNVEPPPWLKSTWIIYCQTS